MLKDKDRVLNIILISPSILAVLIFIYGFIAWSVRVSLSKWKGLTPDYTWNSINNYIELFNDARFAVDVRNTLIFTGVFVIGSLTLGFLLAVMLDQGLRGEGFFRSLFLFPMAISYIVTGVVWRWLMNPAMGSRMSGFNLLFANLGLDSWVNEWHTTPQWGMAAIALAAIWQMSGYTMALYLAGLRAIPHELKEAARIDGATRFQAFLLIVMPLSSPGIIATSIFSFIGAWNEYVYAYTFLSRDDQMTLPVGIQRFFTEFATDWPGLMAATFMMSVPVVVMFLVLQKYFVRALTEGAVKH